MKLKPRDMPEDLTVWIVVSSGEGHFECESKDDAMEQARVMADGTPNLVVGVYRLAHFVSARVGPVKTFDPPNDPGDQNGR